MNRVSTLFCGITLSSVILTSVIQRNEKKTIAAPIKEGNLAFVVNGEDFVRQGFVSKDNWEVNFDHVYINVDDTVAYSTSSSFEPQKGDTKESIDHQDKVSFLDTPKTADLAEGGTDAEPILVSKVNATEGFYNALSWKLITADSQSAISGKTMVLIGKAVKDGETVNFNLGFNNPTEYVCGEFIGDERQGVVAADTPGTVEATFHFDHIFGDANTPIEDALNQDALGFQPIAELASNGTVDLDDMDLASQLSAQNYQKLTEAIAGLGHVGEGHCVISND